MNISLPDDVKEDEKLARIICASSKSKRYKRTAFYYDENESKYIIIPSQFIDTRNPAKLSVNRISTLTIEESHQLGINHQQEKQSKLTYHGFAEMTAKLCFENDCRIEKDDVNGTKPYHANILYPHNQKEDIQENQKEDIQEIAIQLAYSSTFIKFIS